MANGTTFGSGASGTYSVPAVGVGEYVTTYGWFNLPAAPSDDTELSLGTVDRTVFSIVFESWLGWGGWALLRDDGWTGGPGGWWGPVGPSPAGGQYFLAVTHSRTEVTLRWRSTDMRTMGSLTVPYSYAGGAFTGNIGGFGGNAQYVGIYQGNLTDAQLLAQSQSTTPIESAYSFFPLNENSGTGTIGGRNMTLSGTSTASSAAPASSIGAIDSTQATEFGHWGGEGLKFAGSPFAVSETITVSLWIWLGPDGEDGQNAYAVYLAEEWSDISQEHLIFVVQNDQYVTGLGTNLMSLESSDWGGGEYTATSEERSGWVFVAWTIESTGTSRHMVSYCKLGVSASLQQATILGGDTKTETGWSSAMRLGVAWNGNGAKFRAKHFRIHTTALTSTQIDALSLNEDPDTSAWCDIPFIDTDCLDVSGNDQVAQLSQDVLPGDGPVFPASEPSDLSGTSAGASTVVGDIAGKATATGTSAGAATVAGDLSGVSAVSATASGASTLAGDLAGLSVLSGASTGSSTVTGATQGTTSLSASSAGAATLAGEARGLASLSGSAGGTSTASGAVGLSLLLTGFALGQSTVSGAASGLSTLAGDSAGVATASAAASGLSSVSASEAGAATATGSLGAVVSVSGASTGSSAASGAIASLCSLVANDSTAATVAGALLGFAAMTALVAGTSSASGDLQIPSTSGDLSASVIGTSQVSGNLVGAVAMSGAVGGLSIAAGNLLVGATLAGSAAASASVSANLLALATLSGQTDGAATASGATSGWCAVSATADGAASVSGVLLVGAALSGQADGSSVASGDALTVALLTGSIVGASAASGFIAGVSELSGDATGTSTVSASMSITGAGVITGGRTVLTMSSLEATTLTISPIGAVALSIA